MELLFCLSPILALKLILLVTGGRKGMEGGRISTFGICI
jgi:hypothetical protein